MKQHDIILEEFRQLTEELLEVGFKKEQILLVLEELYEELEYARI